MKKYYEILEVNPKASLEVIQNAYKVLTDKYRPQLFDGDKKDEAEQKIRDINEAYKILSDEFLRQQYDIELEKETKDRKENNNIFGRIRKSKKKEDKNKKEEENTKKEKKFEKSTIGTYKGLLEVTTAVFKNKPNFKKLKDLKTNDFIALGLTAVIMIALLVALWFIPITNGFIRNMLPFLK